MQLLALSNCQKSSYLKSNHLWPTSNYLQSSPWSSSGKYSSEPAIYDYGSQGISNRDDQDEEHYLKKYTKVEHHQAEGKEISFVYPVLLALLILGALFIPFMSLFFFLAVSAFNCNGGLGSGFGQVTPVFGRRRRRRKRSLANETSSRDSITAPETTTTTTTTTSDTLPAMMLFDAIDGNEILMKLDYLNMLTQDHYEFVRKQLARNTIKLGDALIKTWLTGMESDEIEVDAEEQEHD